MKRIDYLGQIFGEYRLLDWLGGGSFGDVYRAEHIRDHHIIVAVKVLEVRLTQSEELKEFINEARTIRLKHPHIVPLLDFGISANNTPFLVMDYAPHGNLRQRHPKGSRLPLATVVSYVTPLASALQYAHDHHLVHRDVKPENMLVGKQQEILLSDFGIAVVTHSSRSTTLQEVIGGTVPYMAPEQLQGQPRAASDQYALGIVVYEWLCGQRPFEGTGVEIAVQHATLPPRPLRHFIPELPIPIEQVILKALAKDPDARFPSAQDFAFTLEQVAQGADLPYVIMPDNNIAALIPTSPLSVPQSSLESTGAQESFTGTSSPMLPLSTTTPITSVETKDSSRSAYKHAAIGADASPKPSFLEASRLPMLFRSRRRVQWLFGGAVLLVVLVALLAFAPLMTAASHPPGNGGSTATVTVQAQTPGTTVTATMETVGQTKQTTTTATAMTGTTVQSQTTDATATAIAGATVQAQAVHATAQAQMAAAAAKATATAQASVPTATPTPIPTPTPAVNCPIKVLNYQGGQIASYTCMDISGNATASTVNSPQAISCNVIIYQNGPYLPSNGWALCYDNGPGLWTVPLQFNDQVSSWWSCSSGTFYMDANGQGGSASYPAHSNGTFPIGNVPNDQLSSLSIDSNALCRAP